MKRPATRDATRGGAESAEDPVHNQAAVHDHMDDDALLSAVYQSASHSFRTHFHEFMNKNDWGSGSFGGTRMLLYTASAHVPILREYVNAWFIELSSRKEYAPNFFSIRELTLAEAPFYWEHATYYSPSSLPSHRDHVPEWILHDVVGEIRRTIPHVAEIWLYPNVRSWAPSIVVVNESGLYDIFSDDYNLNDENDHHEDNGHYPLIDDYLAHRLAFVKRKEVDTSAMTETLEFVESNIPSSMGAGFVPDLLADILCHLDVDSPHRDASNEVREASLQRAALIPPNAHLVLARFCIRAIGISGWEPPRANRLYKRLYLTFAKRRWLNVINATRHIAQSTVEPGSVAFAGAMGRLHGTRPHPPFASYDDCMASEYQSKRQLMRFAQEYNQAKGRPPPSDEGDDDDAFRSRICTDLMRA